MDKDNQINKYKDIIHLPHHVSKKHPQMAIKDRAAQFAPFAAVVGHEEAIKEVARYTDQRKELDETEKAVIDNQLQEIESQLPNSNPVEIVYFQPDVLKSGGAYIVHVGKVKKIDSYTGTLQMIDGVHIAINEIARITIAPIDT